MVAPLLRPKTDAAQPPVTPDEPSIDFAKLVRHMWGFRWHVLAGTAAIALCAGLISYLFARTYEAASTVIVNGPPDFNVEALQLRARSQRVVERVAGAMGADAADGGLGEWKVTVYPSRTPGTAFLPWLSLSVAADSPERAQAVVNSWARVLVADPTLIEPGEGSPEMRQADRLKAEATLLEAERRLHALQLRQADETARLNAEHDVAAKSAELSARQARIVAVEEELADIRRMRTIGTSGGGAAQELRMREQGLSVQLERHRAGAAAISREITEARREVVSLEHQQAVARRPLERALGEAIERRQIAVSRTLGAVRLELGEPARLPPDRRARAVRASIVSLPFGLLLCLTVAFLAGLSREVQKPSTYSW